MDVRIGITQTSKELELEMGDETDQEGVVAAIEVALGKSDGMLWLTDRRGRRVGVPASKLAYVEVTASSEARRVGFGAP